MQLEWNIPLTKHPQHILEEAGYHAFVDPNTQKTSYIMRVSTGFYPRYHVYIQMRNNRTCIVDLHIDQKKASYEGYTAHAGEYEGALVEEELMRLQRWFQYYAYA